jgi:hypothetical protein
MVSFYGEGWEGGIVAGYLVFQTTYPERRLRFW